MLLFLAACCLPAPMAQLPPEEPPSDRDGFVQLEVDGHVRNYFLHVPEDLPAAAPLVLVFHGGGAKGRTKGVSAERTTRFSAVADRVGFAVAYPSSFTGIWGDGRRFHGSPPDDVDDVAFVRAVIDDVHQRVGIDRDQVFATGISNGGFFTLRLACDASEAFRGFASVIGSLAADLRCEPTGPVAVYMIAGTEDAAVPFEGGVVGRDRGATRAVQDVGRFWAAHNGCDPKAASVWQPAPDAMQRIRVRRHTFTGCAAPVRVDEVRGLGHRYPGGPTPGGDGGDAFDATAEIAAWFAALR